MAFMVKDTDHIMVTGALGQIGSELIPKLKSIHGKESVIATDVKKPESNYNGVYEELDVLDHVKMRKLIQEYDVDIVYHLAAILSATGEKNPDLAWKINVEGLHSLLDLAREKEFRVFIPSSIAVFGPETPRVMTPQNTVLKPRTMYGITKVIGELLGNYYYEKYGVDVRGVRFPGIISNVAKPGGGTTDYAVEIFYEAIKNKKYTCFLRDDTMLPMMYMPDCLKAFISLMNVESDELKHRCDFNLSAMSFDPKTLAKEIKKHMPEFEISYKPDYRQEIADSWPESIDDSTARDEWSWKPDFDLPTMVQDMLKVLQERFNAGNL
jgi:threonine 3-dehydrogenase